MKRTTKSLIALLVLVAMCVSFCVPVFATDEHAHTTEGACSLAGKNHTLADLGLTPEEAKANGYLVEDKTNCLTGGYSVYKCVICAAVDANDKFAYFIDNYSAPGEAGHDFTGNETNVTLKPTCTEEGTKVTKCNRCGDVEEKIPALKHDFDKTKTEWYKNGVKVESYYCTDGDVVKKVPCSRCDVVEETKITAGEHDFTSEGGYKGFTKVPTCVEKGEYKEVCAVCEYEFVIDAYISADDVVADEHRWDTKNAEEYQAPTCKDKGKIKGATCLDCGAKLEGEQELSNTGIAHEFTKKIAYKAPTCFEDGMAEGYVCVNCDALPKASDGVAIPTVIPAIEHKNATRVEAESITGSCLPATKDPAGVKAGEYMAEKVELTEENGGWAMDVYTCPDCKGAKYYVYTAPYEHAEKGKYTQAPTHTQLGLEVMVCLDCGWNDPTTLKTLPKYTHELTLENALANKIPANLKKLDTSTDPDCENSGTLKYQCTACYEGVDCVAGTIEIISVIVPALEHDYVKTEVKATCSKLGYWVDKCSRCGEADKTVEGADAEGKYDYDKEIPDNAPHRFPETNGGYTITTTPTCYQVGYMLKFCLDCTWVDRVDPENDESTPNYIEIPKLTHTKTLDTESGRTTKPTCTAPGNNHYICTHTWTLVDGTVVSCDWTEDIPVNATKHSWTATNEDGVPVGKLVKTVEPTCTVVGWDVYECTNENCKQLSGDTATSSIASTRVAKLGHTYEVAGFEFNRANSDDVIYPSCKDTTKLGQFVFNCDRCTASVKKNISDKTDPDYKFNPNNHLHHANPVDDTTIAHRDSTCSVLGVHAYICVGCKLGTKGDDGIVRYDFAEVLPGKTHYDFADIIDTYLAPGCETDGHYETFRCTSDCKLTYYVKDGKYIAYTDVKDTIIPATKHNYTKGDCTTDQVCQNNCGSRITAPGHKNVDDEAVPATCTEPGLTAGTHCEVCGTVTKKQEPVSPTNHTPVNGKVVLPLCEAAGYTPVSCSVCHEAIYFASYKAELDHDFTVKDTKKSEEPTCIAAGVYYYGCSRCDTTERHSETVKKLSEDSLHTNAAGQKFDGESCLDKDGKVLSTFACTVCSVKEVEHTVVKTGYGEDCTKLWYELEICSVCNTTIKSSAVNNGYEEHKYVKDTKTEVFATIGTPGYYYKKCERCGLYELNAEGAKKKYDTFAENGVRFDFGITDLQGGVAESYAGRFKLVISTTTQNAKLSAILLKLKFDNKVLKFVGGKLVNTQFEQSDLTFTAASAANADGHVNIMVTSINNAEVNLAAGEFAVLEFEIIDKKTAGQEIKFEIDETSEITPTEEGVKDFYGTMPTSKTRALGKVATTGETIGLADFDAMVEIAGNGYSSEADITMDGNIDAADIVELRKYLLGNDSTLD